VLHAKDDSILEFNNERCDASYDVSIDTYEDHRMAMAFAPACIKLGKVIINEPHVVTKSYPTFWEDLQNVGFGLFAVE
ncbi:MAG: 3-phosphoshikimate 1-carboxyvinyltransferase, partial [Paludibacteraceae bacterium]|nr:3-phosphoshikimate 1-carboxyvinyltransferase [Paludibacteraceae bacterium]